MENKTKKVVKTAATKTPTKKVAKQTPKKTVDKKTSTSTELAEIKTLLSQFTEHAIKANEISNDILISTRNMISNDNHTIMKTINTITSQYDVINTNLGIIEDKLNLIISSKKISLWEKFTNLFK